MTSDSFISSGSINVSTITSAHISKKVFFSKYKDYLFSHPNFFENTTVYHLVTFIYTIHSTEYLPYLTCNHLTA